jgi:hypothetical protein
MRFMMIVLLIFSGASIWLTLRQTPAFNPQLIADTVVGDGRVFEGPAMYDLGAYAFQRGYGFLIADTLISPDTQESDQDASSELAADRARLAVEALELAVSQDPGNAHAWAFLAWARARLGNNSGAMEALHVSWKIAPNNKALADMRLNLAGLLTDPEIGFTEPTKAERASMARDMEVLSLFDRRALAMHMEIIPHQASLAKDTATK